jgi:hypothetical protein
MLLASTASTYLIVSTYIVTIVLLILFGFSRLSMSFLECPVLRECKQQGDRCRETHSRYRIPDPADSRNGGLVKPG